MTGRFHSLLADYPDDARGQIKYAMGEVVDNIHHHAESNLGFCIHAQKYPYHERVEIAVADFGIGIDNSLKKNPEYVNLSANQRFERGIELGVTATPARNSGEGLSSILEWISANAEFDSKVVVFSNNHMLVCKDENGPGILHADYFFWPGTLIWLSIPDSPRKMLVDVWKELGLSLDEE